MNARTFCLLASLGLASFAASAQDPGQQGFITCSACHGMDGKGLPIGALKMAPPLAGSAVVNGNPEAMALAVMKGIEKEGAAFIGIMAPLEAAYDDEKLAAVLTYVRSNFDNKSAAVTKEQVAGWREKYKDIKAPVKRAKVEELSKQS